ncbi:NotI family restriction endonuclease [Neptuniibacter sp. 1_MG-2023]|uniref:NotI family restriction endonuclease n=1 Tax=Neptuniibacter sp. 1_MG-2023 TaxID=3062662 RepID=UPI0026E21ADC|nr:NotI family restriction endonuclease [Neptuniibacter sp. 1_MG-2023]MDO6595264.1 NotI family restriction endonuclease [Neptuniibacter sp. 1_MG-2023]
MIKRPKNDIIEIFGYAPDDLTKEARTLWNLGACPFVNKACSKSNSDQTVVYGTCSVTTTFGDCIICPNRIYEKNYLSLKKVAEDAFGDDIEFLTFEEFIPRRSSTNECIVALGQNSGKEVKLGNKLSMDWVLAKVKNGELIEYVGIEVQSIDITNNYRDNWYAYKNLNENTSVIPRSEHGLNWANVHKRLIPQLIRKGLIYAKSDLVSNGLYFVLPDIVYRKFEDVIGKDIPLVNRQASDVLTVHTYSLSDNVEHGKQRELIVEREIRFELEEFSQRFISGANLPTGEELDSAVRKVLGIA